MLSESFSTALSYLNFPEVKNPEMYAVNRVYNADGVEVGYDVYLKAEKVMLRKLSVS